MTRVVEAVFTNGALRPLEVLDLREQERVRLIVQTLDTPSNGDRAEAMARLRAGIAQMDFHLSGPLPTRDELHDRR